MYLLLCRYHTPSWLLLGQLHWFRADRCPQLKKSAQISSHWLLGLKLVGWLDDFFKKLNFFRHILYIRILYERSGDNLRTLPYWIRCRARITANRHSWKKQSSCSHSYSQLLFRTLLAQLFVQLCGDRGKHPAERQSNFCWISFRLYPFPGAVHHMAIKTNTLSQRSGLCTEGQTDYFWPLDAGLQCLLNHSLGTQLQHRQYKAAERKTLLNKAFVVRCHLGLTALAHVLPRQLSLSWLPGERSSRARLQGATGV